MGKVITRQNNPRITQVGVVDDFRYSFEPVFEVLVWHTTPHHPTANPGLCPIAENILARCYLNCKREIKGKKQSSFLTSSPK